MWIGKGFRVLEERGGSASANIEIGIFLGRGSKATRNTEVRGQDRGHLDEEPEFSRTERESIAPAKISKSQTAVK